MNCPSSRVFSMCCIPSQSQHHIALSCVMEVRIIQREWCNMKYAVRGRPIHLLISSCAEVWSRQEDLRNQIHTNISNEMKIFSSTCGRTDRQRGRTLGESCRLRKIRGLVITRGRGEHITGEERYKHELAKLLEMQSFLPSFCERLAFCLPCLKPPRRCGLHSP